MENAYRIFDSRFSSHTLNSLYNYLPGLLVGIQLGLINHLIDIACRIHAGLVLHAFNQAVLGFLGREARKLFQLDALLLNHLLQILLF